MVTLAATGPASIRTTGRRRTVRPTIISVIAGIPRSSLDMSRQVTEDSTVVIACLALCLLTETTLAESKLCQTTTAAKRREHY
jgi:hypothetical protein